MSVPDSLVDDIDSQKPLDAAALWFARRRDNFSQRDEEEFGAWLEVDPAHRKAYEAVTRSWELAGEGASHSLACEMRSEALLLRPQKQRRVFAFAAAAASIIAIIFGAISLAPDAPSPTAERIASAPIGPYYLQTAIGERSTVTLEDGSVVTLNTNSRLRVDYRPERRYLVLLAGQALFQVAKNRSRPFVVRAKDREVIALGTEFEVKLDKAGVRVALIAGRVDVRAIDDAKMTSGPSAAPLVAKLEPGEQLVTTSAGAMSVAAVDVENLTSWREGRVRFDDTPLSEAVTEMNRYSRTPIIISDRQAAAIRISGAFRTGQSRSFADAVAEVFPVRAETTANAIVLKSAD